MTDRKDMRGMSSHWNKVLLHGCKEDEVRKRPPNLKPGMGHIHTGDAPD